MPSQTPADGGHEHFSSKSFLAGDWHVSLILGLSGCLAGFCIVVVSLRCYARGMLDRHFWHDDYAVFLAIICSIIVLGCLIGEVYNGLGQSTSLLSSENREYLAKIGYIHAIFGTLGISAVKISCGFFILRTIDRGSIQRPTKMMIGFLLTFTVITASIVIFQCVPAAALWDSNLDPSAHCLTIQSYTTIGLVTDAINTAIDIILSTLPLPLFYDSCPSTYSRMALIGIVALGYVACSAAVIKTVYRVRVLAVPSMWRESDYTLWNNIELQIGILASSLPIIYPVLTIFVVRIYSLLKTPIWPTNSCNTSAHCRGNGSSSLRMNPTSRERQSHPILHSHHLSSSTTEQSNTEQHRCPLSFYRVEISASRLSGSQNVLERDAILAGVPSGFPAIVRTTDIYIQVEDRNVADEEDTGIANTESQSACGRWKLP
ncbi:hypothetical protein GX48_01741 [Paracoccidioides brasiliensis]|nr:hypothetical protein GX48_01741 [Paracoccidioides brasiliensis]